MQVACKKLIGRVTLKKKGGSLQFEMCIQKLQKDLENKVEKAKRALEEQAVQAKAAELKKENARVFFSLHAINQRMSLIFNFVQTMRGVVVQIGVNFLVGSAKSGLQIVADKLADLVPRLS